MKSFYSLLVALLLLSVANGMKASSVIDDGNKKEIILINRGIENHNERSLYHNVEAFYCLQTEDVEVTCYDEGSVAVYLFNSRNQMCGFTEFDSSVVTCERLDVPKGSGTYHITIITDKSYSEGSFTK